MTFLIASSLAALAATLSGVGSCRYLFIDFTSDRGDFSDMYTDPTADGPPVQYRAGAGLFTWLQPFGTGDWSDGQCTGYNQVQLSHITDDYFEVARIFAVLSVLTGMGVSIWTLFLSCLSMTRFQIWILSGVFFALTAFCGCSSILFMSLMCTDELVSFQDESYTVSCTLDQGGLVVIAAAILWCVSFLLTVIYIKPPESDMTIVNGQITNAFERRMEQRKKQREKQLQKLMSDQQKAKMASIQRQKQLDQVSAKKKQQQQQQRISPRQQQQRRPQSPPSQQLDPNQLQLSRTGSSTPPQPTPINRLASPRSGGSGGVNIYPTGSARGYSSGQSPPGAIASSRGVVVRPMSPMSSRSGGGVPSPSGAVQAYRSPRSPSGVIASSGNYRGHGGRRYPGQYDGEQGAIEVQVPRSASRSLSPRGSRSPPGNTKYASEI